MDIKQPHSTSAEGGIIGAILNNNSLIVQCIENINKDDFYNPHTRLILSTIYKRFLDRKSVNEVTIDHDIAFEGTLKENKTAYEEYLKAGGIDYLSSLRSTFKDTKIDDFIEIVKEDSVSRLKIKLYSESQLALLERRKDSSSILAKNDNELFLLNSGKNNNKGVRSAKSIINLPLKTAHKNMKSGLKYTGFRTYLDIDNVTLGISNTDLVAIGAESSTGKTGFSTTIVANNIRYDPKKAILIFTLEMSNEQILNRLYADLAHVNSLHIRGGNLSPQEWIRLSYAKRLIESANIYIDDTNAISPMYMYSQIQKLLIQGIELDAIIVDYIQLCKSDYKQETRNLEVAYIANTFKNMAKELKIPIITLSQLNKGKDGNKPDVNRIRDSNVLLEAADTLMLLYREERDKPTDTNKGKAEVIIGKNRNGPIGTVNLGFIPQYTKFVNIEQHENQN